MPFFFKPFRIAAKTINRCQMSRWTTLRFCVDKVLDVWERECVVTLWQFHLSEAFDWRRDAVSINQDVKLLPDTLISGVWHIQDIAWCLPATSRIHGEQKKLDKKKRKKRTWSRTYLVFMGSSYMIPLAISFTDIRADRGVRENSFSKCFNI